MVETEEKYNFKILIADLKNYIAHTEISDSNYSELEKIIYKLGNIDSILENIDEQLLEDDIDSEYRNCKTYATNIINGNITYNISNLNSSINNIFTKLTKYINYNMLFGNSTKVKNYIKQLKYNITKQSNILENEVNDIKESFSEKRQIIDDMDSDLNQSIINLKNELNQLINDKNNLATNINTMLEDERKKVDNELNEKCDELETAYATLEQNYKNKLDLLTEDYQQKFDNLLNNLQNKDKQISTLIGLVGKKSKIGEYNRSSRASFIERVIWQGLTVALFIISAIIIGWLIFTVSEYDKLTLIKFGIGFITMSASFYTAKQASNSRKDEVYYKKQELELASIDVYLESLTPESREEIKKNLSDKMFGQAKNTYTNKYEDKKGIGIQNFKEIADIIKSELPK